MSSIPKTRADLVDQQNVAYEKLSAELGALKAKDAELTCTDEGWRIKDMIAVRVWWSKSVVDWIEKGRQGRKPIVPASGYKWSETPRLNNDIVEKNAKKSWPKISKELDQQFRRVSSAIDSLSDAELLETGQFSWAEKWPVARWISINTTRQYVTARTMIRRAVKQANA